MAVDPQWLAKIRAMNRERFGMAGLGDLGYVSAQDLVTAIRGERELRTASIHRGRFERQDPLRPEPGSVESVVQALGPPPELPPSRPIPRGVYYAGGAALLLGVAYLALRRS